jgi:DNA-binding MarR family transcriptional regulator
MRKRQPIRAANESAADVVAAGPTLDIDRYVPAFVTFIANKLSRSATVFYQQRFGVNITEWRIMSLLAIEPGIPASRICHVIGFDKGPVNRTLASLQRRGLIAIRTDPDDGRSHAITLTPEGRRPMMRSLSPRWSANAGCCPA